VWVRHDDNRRAGVRLSRAENLSVEGAGAQWLRQA
jgi:hypothetical protein